MSDQLHQTLKFPQTTIVELSFYPGEKGLNAVLALKAPFTIEAARVLECEERFYTLNERPYTDYKGRLTVTKVVKSCQFNVGDPRVITLLPDMVWKFNIGLEKNSRPSIGWRVHLDGQYRQILVDMVHGLNKDELYTELVSLQGRLFIVEEEKPSGDGDRVDMSGQKDDRQMTIDEANNTIKCEACTEKIPMGEGIAHEDGRECAFRKAAAVSVEQIPDDGKNTLGSARQQGGTHQSKAKRKPKEEEVPDSPYPTV